MELFYYPLLFILGACVGSFLNVLVERTAREEAITGRSYCEFCNKQLKSIDLLPIISYLLQNGSCRYCKHPLTSQYIMMEVITGTIFVIVYYLISQGQYLQFDLQGNILHLSDISLLLPLGYFLTVCAALIALFLADIKYGMLFDQITIPAIIFVIIYKIGTTLYLLWQSYIQLSNDQFGQYLLEAGYLQEKANFSLLPFVYTLAGSLGIALFFLILIIVTKGRGMGGGDVKLGLLIGLIAGWPYMIAAIMIGFLTGSLCSLILVSIRKRRVGQTIPFGPFLIIGCVAVMFFGNEITNWYITTILGLDPVI